MEGICVGQDKHLHGRGEEGLYVRVYNGRLLSNALLPVRGWGRLAAEAEKVGVKRV